jgi:hypothetical protein
VVKVPVTSTTKVSFSDDADAKTNNALSFRHTASSTLQLVVASVDNKFSKGSTKSNSAMLIDLPTSQRKAMILFYDGSSQIIGVLNSEGARAPSTTFPTLNNRKIELIVASHFSKTFLHFGKGFAIFCEGDWENANNGNDAEDYEWNLPSLLSL